MHMRLAALVLCCAMASHVHGTKLTYYVDADAAPGGTGTMAKPWSSLDEMGKAMPWRRLSSPAEVVVHAQGRFVKDCNTTLYISTVAYEPLSFTLTNYPGVTTKPTLDVSQCNKRNSGGYIPSGIKVFLQSDKFHLANFTVLGNAQLDKGLSRISSSKGRSMGRSTRMGMMEDDPGAMFPSVMIFTTFGGAEALVENTDFISVHGGGVFFTELAKATVSKCFFQDVDNAISMSADSNPTAATPNSPPPPSNPPGSTLRVEHTTMINGWGSNSTISIRDNVIGGYAGGMHLEIDTCELQANTNGDISAIRAASVSIVNSHFIFTSTYTASVFVYGSPAMKMSGTTFKFTNGTALFYRDAFLQVGKPAAPGPGLVISNTTFTRGVDSAIKMATSQSPIDINHCIFEQNTAVAYGGAIWVQPPRMQTQPRPTITIRNSQFTNNTATQKGGAIFVGADPSPADRVPLVHLDTLKLKCNSAAGKPNSAVQGKDITSKAVTDVPC